jgi:DNA polymerase III epsilon subunit-like protein
VDCETTGLSYREQEALSVAVVLADAQMQEVAAHHWLILPERLHTAQGEALVIAGYDPEVWAAHALPASTVAAALYDALKGMALIAHNLAFDRGFIADVLRRGKRSAPWSMRAHCTLSASRAARTKGAVRASGAGLTDMCAALGLPLGRAPDKPHNALDDARAALALAASLRERGLL